MKYLVRKSIVKVVGKIWMPNVTRAQVIEMCDYDLQNATDENGNITRESLGDWLDCNAGDFASILDFSASLEVGGDTVDIGWATEEGECAYFDARTPVDA